MAAVGQCSLTAWTLTAWSMGDGVERVAVPRWTHVIH